MAWNGAWEYLQADGYWSHGGAVWMSDADADLAITNARAINGETELDLADETLDGQDRPPTELEDAFEALTIEMARALLWRNYSPSLDEAIKRLEAARR